MLDDLQSRAEKEWARKFSKEGPGALVNEIEALIPDQWKDHIASWPLSALSLGFVAGVVLGLKRGDEVLKLATTLATSAAALQVADIGGEGDEDE